MAKFTRLLETPLQRRQALKLMAGTAATLTLAACGVTPEPTPNAKTNLLMLRGKVKDLTGRDRERLRAIAAFLDPVNRSRVDIVGEYRAVGGLIVHGKPGRDFIGDGIDMVVVAKGESSAAVREWAAQWADVVDFHGHEAEIIDPVYPTAAVPQNGDPTFLVFERWPGAVAPEEVLEATRAGVYIVSHHVLVNDRRRQVLVVRAPSSEAVHDWVKRWGPRHAVEVLGLTNLSERLRSCARSSGCAAETATSAAAPLATVMSQGRLEVTDYHPEGLALTTDQKLGTYYFRHQATGRFLSIDDGKVVTVASPSPGDRWDFSRGEGLDSGNYYLQHQGSGHYLNGDLQGHVTASSSPQTWVSGLTTLQTYGIRGQKANVEALLTVDSNHLAHTTPTGDYPPEANWEQWTDYNHPSALEQTIDALVNATTYDAPWPEDSYTGDLLAAYNDILTYLHGQVPKNGDVTTDALDAAKLRVQQKNNGSLPAAYYTVFEHLYDELSYFATLHTWYGDGGHVQTLLTEMTIGNLALISKVQNLVHPPAGSNVKFAIDALMSLVSIAITALALGPAGATVGALLAGTWRIYSSATGGANDTLSTTFADLDDKLNTTFGALITKREDTRSSIKSNWGKLSTFAGLVSDGTLVWLSDTAKVRDAASKQFETSVWQSVLNATWTIQGSGGWLEEIDKYQKPDPSKPMGDPWHYMVQVPVRFIEDKEETSGFATDVCYILSRDAPDSLAKYLFDDADGGLGISMTDFYLGKNGWGMSNDVSE